MARESPSRHPRLIPGRLDDQQASATVSQPAVADQHAAADVPVTSEKGDRGYVVRRAQAVLEQAAAFSRTKLSHEIVLVNGNIGYLTRLPDGRLFSVVAFTVRHDRIVEIDILADPDRLRTLDQGRM